jgi:predicted dehydrogenase
MGTKRIRVGVLGLGKVAQLHHLPGLAALPEFEIAGLCDLAPSLGRRLAARYGLPAAVVAPDLSSLIDRDLDALVVANRHHAPILRVALKAGLPVLVEKPVCWGLEEADELAALSASTGMPVMVGYMKRYDPAVERVIETGYVRDAEFVRIHNFAGGRHRYERLYPILKPEPGEAAPADMDENIAVDRVLRAHFADTAPRRIAAIRTLAELAVHDINLLRGLLGGFQAVAAAARETSRGVCYLAVLRNSAVDCSLEILADFASARDWDEQATFYTATRTVELAFASPFLRNAATVLREQATAGLDAVRSETVLSRESPYVRQLRHFHAVATGGAMPRTPLTEAADDLRLVYDIAGQLEPE